MSKAPKSRMVVGAGRGPVHVAGWRVIRPDPEPEPDPNIDLDYHLANQASICEYLLKSPHYDADPGSHLKATESLARLMRARGVAGVRYGGKLFIDLASIIGGEHLPAVAVVAVDPEEIITIEGNGPGDSPLVSPQ